MTTVDDLCQVLERTAPIRLAEEWDNVGLLVGDRAKRIARVMTCLTITPASVAEAIDRGAGLIVTHHPLPFRPLSRITTDTIPGQLLLQLIRAEVAVYSSHTAYDSAAGGINQSLAEGLGLLNIRPLVPETEGGDASLGSGRIGDLPTKGRFTDLAQSLQSFLGVVGMKVVGDDAQPVSSVAVGCGSAGSLLEAACQAGCDAMVLGETNLHTCLEAEARGVALLLPGHFASERFAIERLALSLIDAFPALEIWASQQESDPVRWIEPGV